MVPTAAKLAPTMSVVLARLAPYQKQRRRLISNIQRYATHNARRRPIPASLEHTDCSDSSSKRHNGLSQMATPWANLNNFEPTSLSAAQPPCAPSHSDAGSMAGGQGQVYDETNPPDSLLRIRLMAQRSHDWQDERGQRGAPDPHGADSGLPPLPGLDRYKNRGWSRTAPPRRGGLRHIPAINLGRVDGMRTTSG